MINLEGAKQKATEALNRANETTGSQWFMSTKPVGEAEWEHAGHMVGGLTEEDEYDRSGGIYAFDEHGFVDICAPFEAADALFIQKAKTDIPELANLVLQLVDALESAGDKIVELDLLLLKSKEAE